MPSASTNSNSKNKLMKQASFGCSSGSVSASGNGGGGGGPGGSTSSTLTSSNSVPSAMTSSSGATVVDAAISNNVAAPNVPNNASSSTVAAENNSNMSNNNNGGSSTNINNENVGSNLTISSSSVKGAEKSVGMAAAANAITEQSSAGNPMRQALITIEHKIRNLEKRKTKLESYRLIQANGKELSSDQKAAVAKYDAVMGTLEFARDLSKQMVQFSKDAEKEQKKQARKDMIAKAQAETAKIREVLIIQNILSCFSDESVRSDFLNGENGAIKLEASDLETIEQFCFDIQTRRPESADDPSFISVSQKAAEYFSMTIDGRPKQYGETTFENLRRVFNQIQECGYLDKIYLVASSDTTAVESNEEPGEVVATEDDLSRGSNSLEDPMEKLNINETGVSVGSNARNTPVAGPLYFDGAEVSGEQQVPVPMQVPLPVSMSVSAHGNEQIDILQKANVINALSMSSPSPTSAPAAANAASMVGVSTFVAPMPPAPLPNRQQSGTTTPVQIAAMYAPPQPGGAPQTVRPQMQQVVPPTAAIIGGLPPNQQPPQMALPPQHHSGAAGVGVQLPPGVSATMGQPPMHAGPPPPPPCAPYSLTTVRAVEQDFFKQHQKQQQQQQQQQQLHHQKYVQQMRPLAEVISGSSFYFLQDSELDSPEIIGGGNNSANVGGTGVIFESPAPNLLVHVGDPPLSAAAVDLQQQQKQQLQSKKHVSQQQSQQQQLQQQQTQQPQLELHHHALQQQQQQLQQLQPHQQSQPIPTQTFTNQTFPPIQPQPPAQPQPPTQLQRHETTPAPSASAISSGATMPGTSKTPTLNSGSSSNTPTAQLFQQQQQNQPQGTQPKTAIYSPDVVIANKGIVPQQQHQLQQQPIMIMTRLAAPQARMPMVAASNVPQQPHASFPFDPMVATFGNFEQQQLAAVNSGAQKLPSASGIIPPNVEDKDLKMSSASDPVADPVPIVNDWESSIKNHTATSDVVNSIATKTAALKTALKHNTSDTSVGSNSTPLEAATNKWSTEMNALSARGNTPPPPSVSSQHNTNNNHSQQQRKNDWTTTSGGGGNGNGNGNDLVVDNTTNHWNTNQPQQQQAVQQPPQNENNAGGSGYGRGGGSGGRNSNNNYQRRSDDRRGDRTTGGGGGNSSYRNRNNYGGGGAQSQQQNGVARGGGGGGMYFRNNENSQGGSTNSYYQNGGGGGLYGKDGGNGSRYDNSGNNSYRGPRGAGGNTNQRNQGPPRSIGRNAGGGSNGNNNTTGGGGSGNTNSSGYINPRQTNRMSMGLEKN